jgi:hypothetical protein
MRQASPHGTHSVTILDHDSEFDAETLRRWAYDLDLDLISQDEDLLIGNREFLPILIPIADDPACPKAGYILASIDFYLMFLVLRGTEAELVAVREAIELARHATRSELHDWAALQDRRLRYRDGIGTVNKQQALTMGDELLNGICRNAEISIVDESGRSWILQLSVQPFHRYKERLAIHKDSGRFVFSR